MMRRLEHRGPDGSGLWSHDQAVLGHQRLAIIDLEGGYQPQLNETATIGVVFNGEIYNFPELRGQLAAAGHVFRTRSDTEVIVHGYEQWGLDVARGCAGCSRSPCGTAARAAWCSARDRLGVKPLYYHRDPRGRLLFASEIKALFVDPGVPRALNEPRLAEYLVYRSVAGEETLFADIRELEPGTLMVLEGDRVDRRRYWTPAVAIASTGDPADVETGRRLLYDAVDVRLVSDVPLGTITSGGLDSSLVSVMAADAAGRSIDTFCVGFADPAYDERPFARAVARRIYARHHDIEVTPDLIERELDRLTWAHDEPLTHPNSIPMHLIFREAKENQNVTVLLSGEGADEVFGGYGWYSAAYRANGCAGCRCSAPSVSSCRAGEARYCERCSTPNTCSLPMRRSRLRRSAGWASMATIRCHDADCSGPSRRGISTACSCTTSEPIFRRSCSARTA